MHGGALQGRITFVYGMCEQFMVSTTNAPLKRLISEMLMQTHHIRTVCSAIAIAVQSAVCAYAGSPDKWIGNSGAELMQAIADTNAPKEYFSSFDGENGIFEILKITDGNKDGTAYVNHFSYDAIPYGKNGGAPENLELLCIASPKWWKATSINCKNIGLDLLNMIPAPSGTIVAINGRAPGIVTEFETDNGVWGIGHGTVGLQTVQLWEPPEELKGDIARILMYVACIYPSGLMRYETAGGAVWHDDPEEGFTNAYAAQLMVWHRNDPPSDYEIRRNNELGKLQGNSNPFVEYPQLAEFLWGTRKDERFGGSTEQPVEDTSMLKAVYSIDDPRINLRISLVPEDAIWKIGERVVAEKYLIPAKIGIGVHELYFESDAFSGMIKIEVN